MLKKWKCILTNWINCYFIESLDKDQSVNLETLINIITHLRVNFNLDESKSSVLGAHTVEEFILEKYPEFKFPNGTTEPSTDNDLYLAASLLLFFVCVNSKDVDIKSAMCNKLSTQDQEIILKFSRNMMEFSIITHKDLQSAIQDACGQDIAAAELSQHKSVAETPPVLRSLHGEVRRLQAALDAERFDRNYLQEELSRSNLKLEKLLKDKEQYKLEILNLKAKISLNSVENDETSSQSSEDNSSKLLRQIQCLEERLMQTQEQVDELLFERDTLKIKVEELRQERDKWLLLSQESVTRVDQLLEELETERRQVQSYKELVSELRTHNQRNGLDSSQLECDDPDASIQSLLHNTSVCSEACANVVEVQLLEEKAKIIDLKQQIQTLQQQVIDLSQRADNDKQKYDELLCEKDEYIFDIKHKLNEEIEEKNLLVNNLNDEITKLNNEMNELEQKYKDHKENSLQQYEKKMEEITILQDEKMSLLQSLTDETAKLETTIKELQNALDSEKTSKKQICEEYDKQIMHLNEKMGNRNNELVELQNNVFDKSEKIESMRVSLEMRESHLRNLMEQITTYEADINELKIKLSDEQNSKLKMRDEYENKLMRLNEKVLNRNNELVELQNNVFDKSEKIESMRVQLESKETDLYNLSTQYTEIEKKLQVTQQQYNSEISSKETVINELEKKIASLIEDISNKNAALEAKIYENTQLNDNIEKLIKECEEQKVLCTKQFESYENKIASLNEELSLQKRDYETLTVKTKAQTAEIENLEKDKRTRELLVADLERDITVINKKLADLQEQYDLEKQTNLKKDEEYKKKKKKIQEDVKKFEAIIDEKNTVIESQIRESTKLKSEITEINLKLEKEKQDSLKSINNLENTIVCLNSEISNRNEELKNLMSEDQSKALKIDKLQKELTDTQETVKDLTDKVRKLDTKNINLHQKVKKGQLIVASEKKTYEDKISELHKTIKNIESESEMSQKSCQNMTKTIEILQKDLIEKSDLLDNALLKVNDLEDTVQKLKKEIDEKEKNKVSIKEDYDKTVFNLTEKISELSAEQQVLKNMVTVTESIMGDQKETINTANKDIEELRQHNKNIMFTYEEEKKNLQLIIQQKEELQQELIEKLKTARETEEKHIEEAILLNESLSLKCSEIENLKLHIQNAESNITRLEGSLALAEKEIFDLQEQINNIKDGFKNEKESLLKASQERENVLNENTILLQSEIDKKTSEIGSLVAQIENAEFIFRNKIESLQDYYNKETQTLISKLVDLENIKDKLESTLNYQHIELKNLRIELEEREIEIKKIHDENYTLNCELQEKQNDYLKLEFERDSLLEMKKAIESDKSQLEEESKILKDQIENEKQESHHKVEEQSKHIEIISNQLSAAQNENEKLLQEVENLNQSVIETRKEMEVKDFQVETLEKQNKNLEEMFIKQSEQIDYLHVESANKCESLTQELKLLQERHSEKSAWAENFIADLKSTIEKLKQEITTSEETIKVLKLSHESVLLEKDSELTLLKKKIVELQNNNIEMLENIKDFQFNTVVLEQKIQELETCIETLKHEKDEFKLMAEELKSEMDKQLLHKDNELNALEKETLNLTNCIAENKKTIDKLNVKITEYEKRNENLSKENEALNAKCSQFEQKFNEVIEQLTQSKNEVENLKSLVTVKNEELAALNIELMKTTEFLNEKNTILIHIEQENCISAEKLSKEIEANLQLQHIKEKEIKDLKEIQAKDIANLEEAIREKDLCLEKINEELNKALADNQQLQINIKQHEQHTETMQEDLSFNQSRIQTLIKDFEIKDQTIEELKKEISNIQDCNKELKIKNDTLEVEIAEKIGELNKELHEKNNITTNIQLTLMEQKNMIKNYENRIQEISNEKHKLQQERDHIKTLLESADAKILDLIEKINKIEKENSSYVALLEENKTVITNLEQLIKHELEQNQHLREETGKEKLDLTIKCTELQGHRTKMEKDLEDKQREVEKLNEIVAGNEKELTTLRQVVQQLTTNLDICTQELKAKEGVILKLTQEKDSVIGAMSKELLEEKETRDKYQKELESKAAVVYELRQKIEGLRSDDVLKDLRKENDELIKAIGHRETVAVGSIEKSPSRKSTQSEKIARMFFQVDNTPPSDISTHNSTDSYKTIADLELILRDKNKTITNLQSDIIYLKSIIADSENKLLDVTKELDTTKENYQQLSYQLKKLANQKNDEIADLKKQVSKMSVTENRATQIIKLSAKYQAIILRRIAEIRSNTVLKEMTNFGNIASENELRRGLQTGTVTVDDLENFLDTTDRHLKRCTEKMTGLQKERDRLYEVSRINESEIISMKKFLTELSVGFKTFNSVKEVYMQKLSKVVTLQRTVRREILNLDGHITDVTMCKLERGYAAATQDLAETALNVERWMDRYLRRTISSEKIKQAFSSELDRASLAPSSYQNAGLEVQIEELEKSFQKLLEEVGAATRGDGARDRQSVTVMEVRAEYEDKLNRMKDKMKQLYQEQISVYKEKQKEEIAELQRDLQRAKEKLSESSRAYEEHIRALTTELWSVGEKFLMQKDEAEWLRRKQRSGSLMSLQHVHSSGLIPPLEEPPLPSDSASLRSLPVSGSTVNIKEREVPSTPRGAEGRLSELRRRNSLCPPHLRSLYPAETQFAPTLDEDEIRCTTGRESLLSRESLAGRGQRKEVGITAYKKPGPPTPSKQAGRLSATDSELRESLRVEADPQLSRKTASPSRLLSLFRSNRHDNTSEMTPRKRLSNIFRKK